MLKKSNLQTGSAPTSQLKVRNTNILSTNTLGYKVSSF